MIFYRQCHQTHVEARNSNRHGDDFLMNYCVHRICSSDSSTRQKLVRLELATPKLREEIYSP